MRFPLDEVAKTVLDASGNGQVTMGPGSSRISWNVLLASVYTSSSVSEPTARLYLNSLATQIAGTFTGSNDSTSLDIRIRNGRLICVWTGGDPGATAQMAVNGFVEKDG